MKIRNPIFGQVPFGLKTVEKRCNLKRIQDKSIFFEFWMLKIKNFKIDLSKGDLFKGAINDKIAQINVQIDTLAMVNDIRGIKRRYQFLIENNLMTILEYIIQILIILFYSFV